MAQDTTTALAAKLKKQLEFYFSDSNYPRDKFLRGKAAENDGWVPIDVISTFSRMKAMTDDVALITAVARTTASLVVSEDGKKVKRKEPIPEKDTINERSIYVKELPVDGTASIEAVGEHFSQFGSVLSVRLRRDPDKAFRGKAYVEMASIETAHKAAAESKNVPWGPQKTPLTVLTKTEYGESRKQKNKEAKAAKKRGLTEMQGGDEKAAPRDKDAFAPGTILSIEGLRPDTDRDNIKEIFSVAGGVRYVDFFAKAAGVAIVRFKDAEGAKAGLVMVNEKKVTVGGAHPTAARILEGEEEKKYWAEKVTPFTTEKPKKGGNRGHPGPNKRRKVEKNTEDKEDKDDDD